MRRGVKHATTRRYAYPVRVHEAADGVTVTCPDVPELITQGATRTEAVARAADALTTALSFYVDDGRPIPRPGRAGAHPVVGVSLLEAAKLALHEAILEQRISNVDLGRRLGMDERAIRRLRDLLHRSHIDTVEKALGALGRRLDVVVSKRPLHSGTGSARSHATRHGSLRAAALRVR
jgi:antitoxin HicB